jgi:hypothetical protein
MTYRCQCCGFEQDFADGEAAFAAGWDAPPHFTGYICCDLCPAVCIVMGLSHEVAHATWKERGRPSEWSMDCATDEDLLRRPN